MDFGQLYKSHGEEEDSGVGAGLKHRFEALASTPIKKSKNFRIVNLRMVVGCGCGGNITKIHAIVPLDKHFNWDEGDRIDDDDVSRAMRNDGIEFKQGSYYGDVDDYDPAKYRDV
jgi:hypothetical protein